MRYLYALAATVLAAAVVCTFFPTTADAAVYEDVLRLHVIAASDSEADQAVKFAVRDALLEAAAPILAGCTSRDEAAERLAASAPLLEQTAETTAGCDAAILLGRERYPTRTYASAALPAGEYLSLRVVLGDGEGKNWWCVLFPPLCLSAATETEAICIEAGLTPEEYRLIAGHAGDGEVRYRIKFKLLELFGELGEIFAW